MAYPGKTMATGWRDNIQLFASAKGRGTVEPVWKDMGNGHYGSHFTAGDELFVTYHVQHDWKRGTNGYPHVHFLVDTTPSEGEEVVWEFGYVIAKGHQQGQSLTAAETVLTLTYTATGLEAPGDHIILECSDVQSFDLLEPDTVVSARVQLVSANVSGRVFGIMADLHYQADVLNTINKKPSFYS